MGYAANGWCFETPDAAASYACGHDYPITSAVVDGAGHVAAVVVECTGTAGNVLALRQSVNGSQDGTSSLALSSPSCDVMEWHTFYPFSWSATDGAILASAIVFAWSVGWGWRALFAVLKGRFSAEVVED